MIIIISFFVSGKLSRISNRYNVSKRGMKKGANRFELKKKKKSIILSKN